ncbi:MAG TPA: phosphate acetyltransferase [Candidatus Eubacterium avistercoris]|uniref:Phosphate acetyltransferase n=1 Tax=Candidatus Eubacterium avistercoris TaxID=2838567 RepID=A0A9D2IFH7_9FIRM|nr:phosphate acetyltransferase [Candidatus Eubacterium avistercoris]
MSFSTLSNSDHENARKVAEAVRIAWEKQPDLAIR